MRKMLDINIPYNPVTLVGYLDEEKNKFSLYTKYYTVDGNGMPHHHKHKLESFDDYPSMLFKAAYLVKHV